MLDVLDYMVRNHHDVISEYPAIVSIESSGGCEVCVTLRKQTVLEVNEMPGSDDIRTVEDARVAAIRALEDIVPDSILDHYAHDTKSMITVDMLHQIAYDGLSSLEPGVQEWLPLIVDPGSSGSVLIEASQEIEDVARELLVYSHETHVQETIISLNRLSRFLSDAGYSIVDNYHNESLADSVLYWYCYHLGLRLNPVLISPDMDILASKLKCGIVKNNDANLWLKKRYTNYETLLDVHDVLARKACRRVDSSRSVRINPDTLVFDTLLTRGLTSDNPRMTHCDRSSVYAVLHAAHDIIGWYMCGDSLGAYLLDEIGSFMNDLKHGISRVVSVKTVDKL